MLVQKLIRQYTVLKALEDCHSAYFILYDDGTQMNSLTWQSLVVTYTLDLHLAKQITAYCQHLLNTERNQIYQHVIQLEQQKSAAIDKAFYKYACLKAISINLVKGLSQPYTDKLLTDLHLTERDVRKYPTANQKASRTVFGKHPLLPMIAFPNRPTRIMQLTEFRPIFLKHVIKHHLIKSLYSDNLYIKT